MSRVVVLGATGSIGGSTLDVLARNPDRFEVLALAANRSGEALLEPCRRHRPRYAVLRDEEAAGELAAALEREGLTGIEVRSGDAALCEVAAHPDADQVVGGIVGAAGLEPTLAAVRAGKRVLLANKECLVMAGALFMEEARRAGATIIPVDSEHNAIFQVFPEDGDTAGVRSIQLTASGGPFRTRAADSLAQVTPEEAVAHPNWDMGRKISVDSATMMNKALEVIEAYWLFALPPDRIKVVVHPESIVHSLVEYLDGSLLAQLGHPDMRTPIAAALAHPDRVESGVESLELARLGELHFEAPDFDRFPALPQAFRALEVGGTAPAILNAANEVAVDAFLDERLDFPGITRVIAGTLDAARPEPADSLDTVRAADVEARRLAGEVLAREAR
ncbi:1-deoxy-D-xylulose 5-phosphate reductoisomerase [Thiohalorhabdus denitrificans]|uniref:1-deoxy-D-xylulose 5-phosphate reductoisomerase n=1 Tax=Thiohalorhabdus denitrificans TaxID=381306 RepID=A0A0P9CFF6_9GAMM|nr:1-deoxy-D-xylulose-5-phosphate reductoisomerase [Thiohalorhabdus denitrificans]KPV41719.1 1-deoxy-D-xylulose 5-phosphate reductoisomerase [Thiohalorhabdus denitrificans]SCY54531.1 1-deoxy-D-xylulose 5-phosphate reductoisomerase [Thiohalorhabdus denitrificans]